MATNSPYSLYREEDSLAMALRHRNDEERSALFLRNMWQERNMPAETVHNVNGAVATYNNINRNPKVGILNKWISTTNG